VTNWVDRFIEAFTLLCGGKAPPRQMVLDWFNRELDSFELQEFALEHTPLKSAQGIAIIDAAVAIADQPQEGHDHDGGLLHDTERRA